MKLLLDTNVLIDQLAQRVPFYQHIRTLCIASYFKEVELWCSVQSYTDAAYALRKFAPKQQLMSTMEATLEFIRPCSFPAESLRPALRSDWPDLEDFLIAYAAAGIKADYVVTRDEGGFQASKVPALSPQAAVDMLANAGLVYDEVSW
ncbi:MAG: PIN domain-containing protein [Coriobacteriia bacterium]|nr:PIN domain-containing protein [Coriobacteriia bacterium]